MFSSFARLSLCWRQVDLDFDLPALANLCSNLSSTSNRKRTRHLLWVNPHCSFGSSSCFLARSTSYRVMNGQHCFSPSYLLILVPLSVDCCFSHVFLWSLPVRFLSLPIGSAVDLFISCLRCRRSHLFHLHHLPIKTFAIFFHFSHCHFSFSVLFAYHFKMMILAKGITNEQEGGGSVKESE